MTIYYWAEHLYDLLMLTVLVPLSLGLLRWGFLGRSERWVLFFLASLLLHELLAHLCILLHTRNHFLYYIQTVAVLCSVAGVYDGTVGPKRLLWQVAIGVSVLMLVEVIFWVGFNHINSVTLTISRLLAALCALVCLNRLFSTKATHSLTLNALFYIHLGFFVFGAFTALNAYFKSYFIETSLDLYYLFNTLAAMMNTVAFGLFSMAFIRIKPDYSAQALP